MEEASARGCVVSMLPDQRLMTCSTLAIYLVRVSFDHHLGMFSSCPTLGSKTDSAQGMSITSSVNLALTADLIYFAKCEILCP